MKHFLSLFVSTLLFIGTALPAKAQEPQIMTFTCSIPHTQTQDKLVRPYGIGSWDFKVVLKEGAKWHTGPTWHYNDQGSTDPRWGPHLIKSPVP